jgi:hypothetical protein
MSNIVDADAMEAVVALLHLVDRCALMHIDWQLCLVDPRHKLGRAVPIECPEIPSGRMHGYLKR